MRELVHRNRGFLIYRENNGLLAVAEKSNGEDRYKQVIRAIRNATEKLKILDGSGFTPRVIAAKRNKLLMEDLGDKGSLEGWTVSDWESWRRKLVRCLITLRQNRIRHGDLNGNNIWVKRERPYFIDWWESNFIGEKPHGESPMTDSYWLFTSVKNWAGNPNLSDPYRICRRWGAIHGELIGTFDNTLPMEGKTLLDVGCFQGDFCAWAAAENMKVTGIDPGGFRSDEDSIAIARKVWKGIPNIRFHNADVMKWPHFNYDVILFMDTFSHLVKHLGAEGPIAILRKMVAEAGDIFFETQVNGDRTGLEWLKTDEDIINLVPGAKFKKVCTIPEQGFPRTLWRISKN